MEIKHTEQYAKKLANEIYPEIKHNNQTNEDFKRYNYGFVQGYMEAIKQTAAPELLEALIEAKKIIGNSDLHIDFYLSYIDKIDNAIKKATTFKNQNHD